MIISDWIESVEGNLHRAFCRWCNKEMRAHYKDLKDHSRSMKHRRNGLILSAGGSTNDAADQSPWGVETVEIARLAVMHLDPVGCGARDVRECLLVQLEVKGESDRLAARLIGEIGRAHV